MSGRLITAPASQISGAQFFTAVTGRELRTPEQKQRRDDAYSRISFEERATYEAVRDAGPLDGEDRLTFTKRLLAAIDAGEDRVKARFADWERGEAEGLTECGGDPLLKDAA